MTDEVVGRLHDRLVEELRSRGHDPHQPLKVSDLYETIIPYQAVRSELGVELNADYQHALLRLLAGDRGLLRVEPPEARAELRAEVEAPYPAVDRFRQFAASDVWVSLPPPDQGRRRSAVADSAAPTGAATPEPAAAAAAPEPPAAAAGELSPAPTAPADDPAETAGACHACGEHLPAGEDVRFCPMCGERQRPAPCAECGTEVDPRWRYCARCGSQV